MIRLPKSAEASELVHRLALQPHPEGGWYRELHRSDEVVHTSIHGRRAAFTSILFLLEAPEVSRLHRLDAEELWNWHAGSSLAVHVLMADGGCETLHLGQGKEQSFQAVVPAGRWFGAEVACPGGWSLVGCVVAPGFEFSRFELARREKLLSEYPGATDVILRLT